MNDIETLRQRFPRRTWGWGSRRKQFPVYFYEADLKVLDARAAELTDTLGYEVNRTHIIEDALNRDPDIQRIKQELNEGK